MQFTVIEPKEIAGLLNLRPVISWRKTAGTRAELVIGGLEHVMAPATNARH